MKNIYAIMTLMFCVLVVGCSDDNNTGKQLLKVVASEASFNCQGGTGTIRVESSTSISATSTEEWCQVAVSENVVNVTVSPNLSLGSRTAMVIIHSAGEEETKVPVYQSGDIFDATLKSTDFTAKGGEVAFHVKSNWDISFEGVDEAWITCTYSAKDEQVTIKAAPLTVGGKYRTNTIKVKSGTHEIPVTFTQANMEGKYTCYIDGGKTANGTCLIEETETAFLYKITPTGSHFDAPYYAKYRKGEFVINFGQYLGKGSDKTYPFVYLCSYDGTKSNLSWGSAIEYVAPISSVDASGKMKLVFKDNGTWPGFKVDGFYYALFTDLLENGGKTVGSGVAAIIDLVWIKQ